ncbi:MAG TPA: hypothetical protein VF432_13710 [Thermoanaerobaculia bacterium]
MGAVVAAVLLILAVLASVNWARKLNSRVAAVLGQVQDLRRDRVARDKVSSAELLQVRNDLGKQFDALRDAMQKVSAATAQLVRQSSNANPGDRVHRPPARSHAPVPAAHAVFDEPHASEDAAAQLLTIANRIVQERSTTLDAFRASTSGLDARVSAWPSAAEGAPVAFIVEHRGTHYAVPNVVKPIRLPQDWFNRSDFGVNDEIQRIDFLPRLRPRSGGYDVQEPGVFVR